MYDFRDPVLRDRLDLVQVRYVKFFHYKWPRLKPNIKQIFGIKMLDRFDLVQVRFVKFPIIKMDSIKA